MSEWTELTWDDAMQRGYEALSSGEALYEEIDRGEFACVNDRAHALDVRTLRPVGVEHRHPRAHRGVGTRSSRAQRVTWQAAQIDGLRRGVLFIRE